MASRRSDFNVLRNQNLLDFSHFLESIEELNRVAVVGGSLCDPEVGVITTRFPRTEFVVFGIEHFQEFMDLNQPPSIREEFDLVLCSNVLEHVFHHENFAKNLGSLLSINGTLWCQFPFSDLYHGSPHFYSSGFDPSYAIKLFERNGFLVEEHKVISSKRLYLFHHLLKDWPSEFRYKHPLVGQIIWSLGLRGNPRPPAKNLSLHRLLICLYLCLISKKFKSDPLFGCGSWVRVRKKESAKAIYEVK